MSILTANGKYLRVGGKFATIESWSSYWTTLNECYELWKVTGEGNMVGKKRGDILTITGTGLNAVYQIPDTAAYKSADTDNCHFKTDGSRSTCDGNRLIGYDFTRTIVKYSNIAPYVITYVMILSADYDTAKMRNDFDLSVWWNNLLSFSGNVKENRGIGKNAWTAESVYDVRSISLFAQMAALGEEPTLSRKLNIDTTIKALKTANLFGKLDGLWVSRAHAVESAKLNWIKDSHNITKKGVGVLTFTPDLGFKGDGACCLNTNFIPSSGGIKYVRDNAIFGYKTSGTRLALTGQGAFNQTTMTCTYFYNATLVSSRIYINENSGPHHQDTTPIAIGYNAIGRYSNVRSTAYINETEYPSTADSASVAPVAYNLYFLAINSLADGTAGGHTTNEVFEIGWVGEFLTFDEYLLFKSIMDSYITNL